MSTRTTGPLGIAVIGAGYWGPNLIRNLAELPGSPLRAVCSFPPIGPTRHSGACGEARKRRSSSISPP